MPAALARNFLIFHSRFRKKTRHKMRRKSRKDKFLMPSEMNWDIKLNEEKIKRTGKNAITFLSQQIHLSVVLSHSWNLKLSWKSMKTLMSSSGWTNLLIKLKILKVLISFLCTLKPTELGIKSFKTCFVVVVSVGYKKWWSFKK